MMTFERRSWRSPWRTFVDWKRSELSLEQVPFQAQVDNGVPAIWDAVGGEFQPVLMDNGLSAEATVAIHQDRPTDGISCPLSGVHCKRYEDFCDGLTDCCFLTKERGYDNDSEER